jgi:RND family efflux transporter MFP subunit
VPAPIRQTVLKPAVPGSLHRGAKSFSKACRAPFHDVAAPLRAGRAPAAGARGSRRLWRASRAQRAAAPPATLITVAQATVAPLDVVERSVGRLESVVDPKIAAEVPGRVTEVLARAGKDIKAGEVLARIDARDLELSRGVTQAEINRIEALLANQQRIVARNEQLVLKNFVSQNVLEDSIAQSKALREQLEGARAQLALTERNLSKTRVVAPADARVQTQIVAPGDYVKVGDGMFEIVSLKRLRAHVPFPENAVARVRIGLPVRLTTPTAPGETVTGTVSDIKPVVGASSRAVEALVRFDNPGNWQPGASVNAEVVIAERPRAVLVPETSVVMRPAGKVVYVIQDGKALARVIETGARSAGGVEVTKGLSGGETVARDGAGFLTDGAAVTVKEPPSQ